MMLLFLLSQCPSGVAFTDVRGVVGACSGDAHSATQVLDSFSSFLVGGDEMPSNDIHQLKVVNKQ